MILSSKMRAKFDRDRKMPYYRSR